MDPSEDTAVQDFLEILEEHRKNCERQGELAPATAATSAIVMMMMMMMMMMIIMIYMSYHHQQHRCE